MTRSPLHLDRRDFYRADREEDRAAIVWDRVDVDLGEDDIIKPALVRQYCRISGTAEDEFLAWLVAGAIETVQIDSRRVIRPRTITATIPHTFRCVSLPEGPFVSANLLFGDDTAAGDPPPIHHDGGNPGKLFWQRIDGEHDGVIVQVRVGDWPMRADIELLILTLVAHRYEHREATTADGNVRKVPIGYGEMVRAIDPMTDAVG